MTTTGVNIRGVALVGCFANCTQRHLTIAGPTRTRDCTASTAAKAEEATQLITVPHCPQQRRQAAPINHACTQEGPGGDLPLLPSSAEALSNAHHRGSGWVPLLQAQSCRAAGVSPGLAQPMSARPQLAGGFPRPPSQPCQTTVILYIIKQYKIFIYDIFVI